MAYGSTVSSDHSRIIKNKSYDKTTKTVDFLSSYTVLKDKLNLPIIGYMYVTKDIACRLDIVCAQYYGTVEVLDLLLKYNGIDDMFAVPMGFKLLIPDLYALQDCYKNVSTDTKYSLDKNKQTLKTFGKNKNSATNVQTRKTAEEERGVGFKVVKPGVIVF